MAQRGDRYLEQGRVPCSTLSTCSRPLRVPGRSPATASSRPPRETGRAPAVGSRIPRELGRAVDDSDPPLLPGIMKLPTLICSAK
jgi:hypothetical protein